MSKVESVVTALNGGDATGLRARIQYLNVQHFPPGLRVGSSKRIDYDLDEVLAYALWFALTRASFTPVAAMALVSDFWPEMMRLFLSAASRAGVTGIKVPDSDEVLAAITVNSFAAYSKAKAKIVGTDVRAPAAAFDIRTSTRAKLASNLGEGLDLSIVIDFESALAALRRALSAEPSAVGSEALDEQLRNLAQREGWSPKANPNGDRVEVSLRKREVPPRGERLGEGDYLFSRAVEVIDAATPGARPGAPSRIGRLVRYILQPSPREEWKRWVEIGDTGIPLIWGLAAFAEANGVSGTGAPQTLRTGALSHLSATGDEAEIAGLLRATIDSFRDYEPIPRLSP